MKVSEPIIRKGFFWKAGQEDHKVSGTLTITNGGIAELEIIGNLNQDDGFIFEGELESNFLVYGQLDKDNYASLYNCYYKRKTNSLTSGISTSVIKPRVSLLGVAFEENEPVITYKSVYFELTDISSWVDISGFKILRPHEQKRFLIDFTMPDNIEIALNDIGSFSIEFNASHSLGFSQEITARQTTAFKIHPQAPISIEKATDIISKIQHFIMLATQETLSIENVKAILTPDQDEQACDPQKIIVKWYYESSPFQSDSKTTKRDSVLFTLSSISSDLELRLNKWLEIYEKAQPSIWLYFSSVTGAHRYSESTFLSLSQAAESYQRNISGNKKINFQQRIAELIKPFSHLCKFDIDNFLELTKHTRNYLTHYNEDIKSKSAKGLELYFLNKKLKDVMTLNILKDIGFSPDELEKISNQAGFLRDDAR